MERAFFSVLFSLFFFVANSQTTTTIANGSWSNASIWSNGIPGNTWTAIINTSVVLDMTDRVAYLTINSGASLINSGFDLRVDNDWTNNGTYTDNSGSVTLRGTTAQTISGKTSFYNLIINGTTITTTDTIWVSNVFNLTGGTIDVSGGILILKNDATHNGRIGVSSNGNIIGNFIVEKWFTKCSYWSTYGSPFTLPMSSLGFFHTGFSGTPYPNWWCNTYYYNEAALGVADSGFYEPTSLVSNLPRGKGFFYYYENFGSQYDFPRKVSQKGLLDFSTPFNFQVTFTPSAGASEDGWNFVANPYPGTIDWSATGGAWTKTRVNDEIHTWNTCLGVYASYVGGVGANGGTRYISEYQGFWVHTRSGVSQSLIASRRTLVNNQSSFLKMSQDTVPFLLKVSLSDDEIAFRMDSMATDSADSDYDAFKLFADSSWVYSYMYSDTTAPYAINSFYFDSIKIVPVSVKRGGILKFNNISSFQGTYSIYLKDLQSGQTYLVYDGYQYQFSHTSPEYSTRFEIHFIKNLLTGTQVYVKDNILKIYPNPICETATLSMGYVKGFDVNVYDIFGNLVLFEKTVNPERVINMSTLPAGVYVVEAVGDGLKSLSRLVKVDCVH
jgi:hypothetical protein